MDEDFRFFLSFVMPSIYFLNNFIQKTFVLAEIWAHFKFVEVIFRQMTIRFANILRCIITYLNYSVAFL